METAQALAPYHKTSSTPCSRATRYATPLLYRCRVSNALSNQTDIDPFQTDASRARLIEAQIQSRVAEELKKLQKQESEALGVAHDKIAAAANSSEDQGGMTRHTVNKQVEDLRRLLTERKQVTPLPESVDSARGDVVRCLTENNRRPLDCWQEVEKFKTEVKNLEQEWVNKVTS